MTDDARHAALMSALTTEHFVLQGAVSSTISESAARSTLYVMALSSSLVAMGFLSQSAVFVPFVSVVLPGLFLLGLFTVVRLVDTALEDQQYLAGIARIRHYYRTLSPDAAIYFSAQSGRWPEAAVVPSLALGGAVAFLGTTATMIAFINNLVAGVGVALIVGVQSGSDTLVPAVTLGAVAFVVLSVAFLAFQKWRFAGLSLPQPPGAGDAGKRSG